jgi:hypothetical protein
MQHHLHNDWLRSKLLADTGRTFPYTYSVPRIVHKSIAASDSGLAPFEGLHMKLSSLREKCKSIEQRST